MKILALTMAISATLIFPAFAGDAVEGQWRTTKDDNGNSGIIQVAPCGDKICGTLIASFDGNGAPIATDNIGKKIIWDMIAQGDGAYSGGKIWSPDRDKTYKSKMQLNGNKLSVKGCVLVVCRDGGTWTRVN